MNLENDQRNDREKKGDLKLKKRSMVGDCEKWRYRPVK